MKRSRSNYKEYGKLLIRAPAQFKTKFDSKGRECTKCGVYKVWNEFPEHTRSATGRASSCKKCKMENRPARHYAREKYCAKKHKEKLKKSDPFLVRARNIRSSLMRRARTDGLDRKDIPKAEEIKQWLLDQRPLKCYYSGEDVDLFDMQIDHKVPVKRGGEHRLSNLCVSSQKMNTAKGALTEEEFKELLSLINKWEDKGESLLTRLRQGFFGR